MTTIASGAIRGSLAFQAIRRGLLTSASFRASAAALYLNFLSGALDSRITFTRGSSATRVNSSGVIVTASTNVARFDYDPVTLAAKGLLIEEQRTNLLLNATIDGANLATQGVTVTAQAYTISFYGTGTITLSGAHAATVAGIGAYPNRKTLTFTPSAGTLTCTVTGTVQYAQVEAGSFATSFIPTAGATVTRSADVATMTGTNFSSWFNASAGTFVSQFDVTAIDTTARRGVWGISDAGNQRLCLRALDSAVNTPVAAIGTGAAVVSLAGSAYSANTATKVAVAYGADMALAQSAGAPVTSASAASVSGTTLYLGTTSAGSYLNGHIRALAYYNTRLSNAQLQSLTA